MPMPMPAIIMLVPLLGKIVISLVQLKVPLISKLPQPKLIEECFVGL